MGYQKQFIFVVSILAVQLLLCVPIAQAIYGGQAGSIFSYGADARSFAMGRTSATSCDDASAVYRNPACLMEVPRISTLFMQASLQAHSFSVMSFAWPGLYEAYGVSMVTLANTLPGEMTDENNNVIGSFVDKQSAMGLAYAKRINYQLAYGLGFKMYSRTLANSSDSFFVFDLGLNYKIMDNISLGGVFNNVYAMNNAKDQTSDEIPLIWRGGIAYKDEDYTFAFDITDSFNQWYLGAEYNLMKLLFLRAGINYEEITFGLGVEYSIVRFDVAIGKQETVGDTMKFSVVVNFGDDKKDQAQREANRLVINAAEYNDNGFYNLAKNSYNTIEMFSPLSKEVQMQVEKLDTVLKLQSSSIADERQAYEHLRNAKDNMKNGRLDSALKEAREAQKIMPLNASLQDLVRFLEAAVGR